MFRISLIFSIVVTTLCLPQELVRDSGLGPRIIGSQDATVVDFPFQLSIRLNTDLLLCGAVLISPEWALTTATCSDYSQAMAIDNGIVIVVANTTHLSDQSHRVTTSIASFIEHPNRSLWTLENDITLLHLSPSVECFHCQPIPLDPYVPQPGDVITTTGWGWAKNETGPQYMPNVLQRIDLSVIDSGVCEGYYNVTDITITQNMFCTGDLEDLSLGFCSYDLGGPAVHNGVLVGLQSEAFGCEKFPRIQTLTASYIDWIKQYVQTVNW